MKRVRVSTAVLFIITFILLPLIALADEIVLYYPPEWRAKAPQARAISQALSESSGLQLRPVVATSYPEILQAFSGNKPVLVYVGSFLQAILHARGMSIPIAQGVDGKEFYASVLIAPAAAGTNPAQIVKAAGKAVAYAKGASSGESGAKAATEGAAAIATKDHYASVFSIMVGDAKCAFVKDWWWKINKDRFKDMVQLDYPGVSDQKNPDNILSANKAMSAADIKKIKAAVMKNAEAFQVKSFRDFDPALLEPTLTLMKKGKINPKQYTW